MLTSMTGFASREKEIAPLGKVCLELRSTNHKFLESVLHLPEGFLVLEDKIKKEIDGKIKRGRVVCVVNIEGGSAQGVYINRGLLKNFVQALQRMKKQCRIQDDLSLNTLIHLPGVLSLAESRYSKTQIWPRLRALLDQALIDLVSVRQKEGRALAKHLAYRAESLKRELKVIKRRFNKVIQSKLAKAKSEEEKTTLLKSSDITEEMERLAFHIRHFAHKLAKKGPVGKELDFIAQEMQREANTMGSKSCDALISSQVVKIKSQVEKIREQVQNIE